MQSTCECKKRLQVLLIINVNSSSKSEIPQFNMIVLEVNILRFDISMDDIFGLKISYSLCQLFGEQDFELNVGCIVSFMNVLAQIAIGTELQEEINVIYGLFASLELDNVRMIQLFPSTDFLLDSFDQIIQIVYEALSLFFIHDFACQQLCRIILKLASIGCGERTFPQLMIQQDNILAGNRFCFAVI